MNNKKVNTQYLYRLSKQLGFTTEGRTLEQLKQDIYEAKKEYNKIKDNHKEHRQTFLENLAEALSESGKGSQASHLKQLVLREEQRTTFRRIKRLKGESNLATTFVQKNDNGIIQDIVDQTEIEEAIIQENRQKYHQCEMSCPFLQPPLVQDFGFCGNGPQMEKFVNGTYEIPPDIDEYTRDYIEVCMNSNAPRTTMERSPEQFRDSWNHMKEKTSSRSLHFGHFKASCSHDLIMLVNYILAEIPFRTGYSPLRWRNATDVMILKKSGLYDVSKLRTIVLYEADFNHNNKFLGRSMMHHAVPQQLISKEQYSIPGKKAIDHALNCRLLFDITRYQKTSMAMTSVDLKSCYDRIVHMPAIMAMHKIGTPTEPITSMFKTIEHAQHITRTAYGDSSATYGGQEEFLAPVMGVGQGNGSGPQVWAAVSLAMFDVMKKRGLSTTFCTPISKQTLDLCGFAYVDDIDLFQVSGTHSNSNNPEHTIGRMQSAIDCWEGVATSTGGAIASDKSWWYIIHFNWDNGKWSYGNLSNIINDTLTCKDKDGIRRELKYIDSSQAVEMLGVFLSPDGKNDK